MKYIKYMIVFFKNTDHGQIRLIVGHRNHPNIVKELGRKRPSSSFIKDPDRKSKEHRIHPNSRDILIDILFISQFRI